MLIIVATSSEVDALKLVAGEVGCHFQRRRDSRWGTYFDLGRIGDEQTIAVRARGMGPLAYRGSADLAFRFKQLTGATAIVQLGMAFGVNPESQRIGDVLVSSCIIPYDNRDYYENEPVGSFRVDYSRVATQSAGPIYDRFRRESLRLISERPFRVFTGAILSGSARIFSQTFRDELIASLPAMTEPIIGGEMEAIGLLGVAEEPIWCVVKGVSDFGDSQRHVTIEEARPLACQNAARFLYSTLLNRTDDDTI